MGAWRDLPLTAAFRTGEGVHGGGSDGVEGGEGRRCEGGCGSPGRQAEEEDGGAAKAR